MGRPPKHYAYTALRKPKKLETALENLPPSVADVAKKRQRLVAGLIRELGGHAALSVTEALLVDRVSRLWAAVELIDRAVFDPGNIEARPLDYLGFVNSLVRATKSLNEIAAAKRQRGAEAVIDLHKYLSERSTGKKPSGNRPEGRKEVTDNNGDDSDGVHEVSTNGK